MQLTNIKPTGNVWLGWEEFSYQRAGHGSGFFRQKGNIRLFFRESGEYYRDGEDFKPISRPMTITQMHNAGIPGLSYYLREEWGGRDAPVAIDFVGAGREQDKRSHFPTQLRFYRDNVLVCFIVQWEGKKVSDFSEDSDFEPILKWASLTFCEESEESKEVSGL